MSAFTPGLEQTLQDAMNIARGHAHEMATLEHLLLALTEDDDAVAVLDACEVDKDALRRDLKDFIEEELSSLIVEGDVDATPTAAFQRVIQCADVHVQSSGRDEVTGANVLVAIFAERESHAAYFLEQQSMTRLDAMNFISHGITKSGHEVFSPERTQSSKPTKKTITTRERENLHMSKFALAVICAFCIVFTVLLNVGIMRATGALDPKAEPLFVNSDIVVKMFVEQATEGMDVEEIGAAMPLLNQIMVDEAVKVHHETGRPILNAKTLLAGGTDVSEAFARRVVEEWKSQK